MKRYFNRKWLIALLPVIAVSAVLLSKDQIRGKREISTYTAYFAASGPTENKDTRIKEKIAEIIGAKADIQRLSSKTAEEKIKSMIDAGQYPDFIDGSSATDLLIDAGALVPLEEHLDKHPIVKEYLTDAQWESLKKADGHIYFIPQYGVVNGHDSSTMPSGEAFWIQKRVLTWAGYPEIKTLDQYFDLIESYIKANPETNGQKNIGFEILCDDWRYFCLENPPMFLAGYPNNGCAVVDPDSGKTGLYDTLPEARQYFKKLNEMYLKGIVDRETFTLSYSQYIEKISSGKVLGLVDQYWDILDALGTIHGRGMDDCLYVPLPITADESIKGEYLCTESNLNTASGIGISVSCKDIDGALSFLEGLLTPEVMKLRYWGEEGVDYEVDEKGVFYRNEEQELNWANGDFLEKNRCPYSQFPGYEGMLADGINTVVPGEQPGSFYDSLSDYDKKLMDAYGHKTWKEFLGEETEGKPWYPLYSVTADWKSDTEYGRAKEMMEKIKRKNLPLVIMADEGKFDSAWEAYMSEYRNKVDSKAYLERLDYEVQQRIRHNKNY